MTLAHHSPNAAQEQEIDAHPLLTKLDRALGWMVEIPAALLVLADIVVLLAGVIFRFALHQPLVWSDELASIIFIWMAMMGSVVAFRRGEHMRMTALVSSLSPQRRALLETVALFASLAFLVLIAWPALINAIEEADMTLPALDIPNSWRATALPVGVVLMALFSLIRLGRTSTRQHMLQAGLIVVCVVAAFWVASPLFEDLGRINLLIFFVGVVGATVFLGIPIAFAFGLGTLST